MPTDPILLEIMRNALFSIADEMTAAMVRTAYSTNIKDRRGCSSALVTPDGEIVAQTELGTPLHLGLMPGVVRMVLDRYPLDQLRPGDVVITNLPYPSGPGHLPDVTAVSPLYEGEVEGDMLPPLAKGGPGGWRAGDEVVALAASTAHHVDVGGFAPGSMPFGVSEIYQEGLQIPPVKVMKEGQLDADLVALITQNVRTRTEFMGDLLAQVAANNVGGRRLRELIAKYGRDTVQTYLHALLDYAERAMRAGIRGLPDGTYTFEDYVEGDGFSDDLLPIRVALTIADDEILVDFDGTSPQVQGPMNASDTAARSCVYYVLKAVLDPDLPVNGGAHRPITVRAPQGSLLNANFPAAIGNANILTDQRVVDVLLGALLQAVPERVCAACSGEMNLINLGGLDPRTSHYYNYVETYAGGQGAMHDLDGMDGVHTHLTNTRNAPVEVLESAYPLRVERYGLAPDSEGAGQFRGGCGMVRELRLLGEETRFSLSADRRALRPWGAQGGHAAAGSDCRVTAPDGAVRPLPSKVTTTLHQGDVVTLVTPGGGGWGDPFQRDPEAVCADVRAGLVSLERAKEVYGVVLDPESLAIDEAATRARR